MKAKPLDYLIMAGGTGGHIFPALAIAQELAAQGQTVAWLGSRQSMESRQVPEAGIRFYGLSVTGLRGKGKLTLLKAPFRILVAVWQALRLLHQLKPRQVVGFGGFASGPGGLAARLLGIPLYIHEQNAFAGMTNRKLSGYARQVFTAFPSAFPESAKVSCIGNPVRKALLNLPPPEQRYSDRQGPVRLLVIGGSLGAQIFNQTLPDALALIPEGLRPWVRHQTGSGKMEMTQLAYTNALGQADHLEVTAFIDDMAEALSWADLVLCRAGALTVSELSAAGVAALLVPFPFAVDDHQTHNARFLTDAKAGVLLSQAELTPKYLAELLQGQLAQRSHLQAMAIQAKRLAKPQATAALVEHLLKDK